MSRYELHVGDCIASLIKLPEKSIHTCVTSPPYYGLRDYGAEGQIGLEETPAEFIQKLVAVFREVHRVLRDDGTLWVNIGDSWSKNKQLMGMPWRLAFALQDDGWYLRQDIIWNKSNPMPESVQDRCTKAHEYVFLLSKSKRYHFDHTAIKEPAVGNGDVGSGVGWNTTSKADPRDGRADRKRSKRDSFKRDGSKREQTIPGQAYGTHRPDREESAWDTATRNRRSVWTLATRPFKGAHFATFPPALVEPCILAGCPVGGKVLDPFGGSGTTAGVAIVHGRDAVLCELNPDYAALVPARIESIEALYGKKRGKAA